MKYFSEVFRSKKSIIILLCYGLSVLPIFAANYFPLIDFYNHISRYFILANYAEIPTLQQYYAPNWRILPNIGLDIIALPFFKAFPPFLAAKLILALLISACYMGFYTIGRHFKGPVYVYAPMAALLSHSYILGWGFANFLLGISFACFLLTKILDSEYRYKADNYSLHIITACVLLLFHGFAFFLFGIISFCLLIGGHYLEIKNLKSRLYKDTMRLVGLSILPILLFLASSTSVEGGTMGIGVEKIAANYSEMPILKDRLIVELLHRIEISFRVMESGFIPFDIILSFTVLLVFVGLFFKKSISINRQYYIVISILLLLWVFMPPTLFNVGYVADRIPLLLMLFLGISIKVIKNRPFIAIFLIFTATIHSFATALYWNKSSALYDEFIHEVQSLPSQKTITMIAGFKDDVRDDNFPRCHPLPHLAFLENEMFTSIFADQNQQPIVMRGSLANISSTLNLVKINRFEPTNSSFQERLDAAIAQKFDYIILCGDNRLDLEYSDKTEVISSASYFKILRVVY